MNSPTERAAAIALMLVMPIATAGQPAPKTAPPPPATAPAPQQDDEALRQMEATSAERREELRAIARTAADRVDARIRALQQRMDASAARMTMQSRRAAQASLAVVRAERKRFAAQVARLDDRSDAALAETRGGVIAAYRDLARALERARMELMPQPAPVEPPPPPANDREQRR